MVLAGRSRKAISKRRSTTTRQGPLVPVWAQKMLVAVLIAAICLTALLSYVLVQAEINEAAAERRSWQRTLRKTIDEHESLQFQLSALQSSSRIEQEAVERLGMTEPSQVIYVNPFAE
jgi:cell division protein FtsL